MFKYIYISVSNILWSCVPCTRAELCEIIKCHLSRKIYVRSFIYYAFLIIICYLFYFFKIYQQYYLFVQSKKPLIIIISN